VSFERDIAGEIRDKSREKRREQRHLDRQLRAVNPGNYNADGTVRKGRKTWVKSRSYQKVQESYADTCRREAAQRKSIHGNLAYDVLALGREVLCEKDSIKGWQRSRYGRSIAKHGPSALRGTLTRKAENARGRLVQVNTYQTALSSTCLCGAKRKKALSERFHVCTVCGLGREAPLPRDTFSAYLALFTESETVSRKKGGSATLSSRLDLEMARRHAPGHRTLSCVLSAMAPSEGSGPASRPAVVEAGSDSRTQVQTSAAADAAGGHERRVPRGQRAKRGGRAGQESATDGAQPRHVSVRKAATSEPSRIPSL